MKKLILLFLVLSINSVWAESGGAGNGGDAIVCPDEVILLDSYEARKMRLTIDLSNENIQNPTWRSMVNVAVNRLQKFDEVTATKLYDYAMEMVNDFEKFQMYPDARGQHVYIGYDVIAEINDSEHVSTPEGCEEHPRQLVSQRVPKFKRELRYEFSKSLWDRMNLQEQSMTILHEAWYRIMLENGAKNSRAARYMNALVASKEFESYTFTEYIEELRNTELKHYIVPNLSESIKSSEIKFDLQNHIINIEGDMMCAPNFKFNPSIKETYNVLNNSLLGKRQKYLKNLKFQNVCFKNSRIRKLVLPTSVANKKRVLRLPFHQVEFAKAISDEPTMYFSERGTLTHMEGMEYKSVMEMYYICDGKTSYTNNHGCEKGPFINHDTKVANPTNILFDREEKPTSHFNR